MPRVSPGTLAKTVEAVMQLPPTDECIIWPHSNAGQGYGQISTYPGHRHVHSVVCELRHGPKPDPLMQAAHSCGVRACYNPRHLSWKTIAGNAADRIAHGTNVLPENVNTAKLTWEDVRSIRAAYATGVTTLRELGREFGVTETNVSYIVRHLTWRNDPQSQQVA